MWEGLIAGPNAPVTVVLYDGFTLRSRDMSDVPVRPAPESMMMVDSLARIALSGMDEKKLMSVTSLSFDGDKNVGYAD